MSLSRLRILHHRISTARRSRQGRAPHSAWADRARATIAPSRLGFRARDPADLGPRRRIAA